MEQRQTLESTLRAREEELAKLLEMKKYSSSVLESMERLAESFRVLVEGSEASASTSLPWEDVATLLAASAAASKPPPSSSAAGASPSAGAGAGAGADAGANEGFLVMACSEINQQMGDQEGGVA